MNEGWSYGGVLDGTCIDDFVRMLVDCFDIEEPRARILLARGGTDDLRFLRDQSGTLAALLLSPMGQYFGGRRVPMTGVAAVGTLPAARGSGVATTLMHECVRDIRAQGVPLSVLYPATLPLYRRAGYENAGSLLRITAPIARLGIRERELELREATEEDRPALRELYEETAQTRSGFLARNDYIWRRVWSPLRSSAKGFVALADGNLEGYLFLTRKSGTDLLQHLTLTDFVAATPRAGRRLFSFLGDYSSLGDEVSWFDGPGGHLLQLLPRVSYQVAVELHWMLRVVDAAAALEARGYPTGMEGELHLELEDSGVPENSGRWLLRVSGGQGTVERGGRGELQLGERGLASLYSGFLSAEALSRCELASGSPGALATATALFGGTAPGMADMF